MFGTRAGVTAVDANVTKVIDVKWEHGSPRVPAELGLDGAFVDKDYADSHHLTVGSPVPVTFADGSQELLNVKGVFDPPTGGSPWERSLA